MGKWTELWTETFTNLISINSLFWNSICEEDLCEYLRAYVCVYPAPSPTSRPDQLGANSWLYHADVKQ